MTLSYKRIYRGTNAELIAHKKTRVISIILLAFAGIIYGFATSSKGDRVNPSPLGVFIYFTALVPLFSCCIAVFKDMHDIPTADVQMSMPLSSAERYLSRLLTVCRIWLIPFLISAAAAMALSVNFAGTHYSYSEYYSKDYSDTYHPSVVISYNFHMLLWFMAAVLFIIAVTVLCQCCVGSKAESRYLPVMLMLILSFFAPALYWFIQNNFANVSVSREPFIYSLWTFSALFVDFDSVRDTVLMCVNCLISLAVIFGGMFICQKRDARTVGKPIVFSLFFEIIIAATIVLFFFMSHEEGGSFVIMFLAWLGSIILRIVVSRKNFSFSKIGIWTGMYFAYYVIFLIFMYSAFLTGGFGSLYKTPSLSDYDGYTAEISADIEEAYSSLNYYSNYDYYEYNNLYSSDFEKNISDGAGKEKLRLLIEDVSSSAHGQSRVKGLFSRRMFGGSLLPGTYKCTVHIRTKDWDSEHFTYKGTIYSVDFYLDRSGAEQLAQIISRYEEEK